MLRLFGGGSGDLAIGQEFRLRNAGSVGIVGRKLGVGGQGAVYFDGCRLPIVGRVSMDSMTIDISALPDGTLDLGSVVEVIGPHQTLERLAEDAGTIAYEILTRLGPRFHRDYRGRARERLHSHG